MEMFAIMNPQHFKNSNWKTAIWKMDNYKMDNWKIDIWKMKNIQHGLVQRRCLVSGRVQKAFCKLEPLGITNSTSMIA